MLLRPLLFALLAIQGIGAQIKKQEHKDFRTPQEIELEQVLLKMRAQFKQHYRSNTTDFYTVEAVAQINQMPFYNFKGTCLLKSVSPIGCESTYQLDKAKFDTYQQAENAIFKKERNPREQIPFYLTSVFGQLEHFYENYAFLNRKDFQFKLEETSDKANYILHFRSQNPKLPLLGSLTLTKKECRPITLEYHLLSNYTFEMSSDNFNDKQSTGYTVRVLKEVVKMTFQETNDVFVVSQYESDYSFKNETKDTSVIIQGDVGHSVIKMRKTTNEVNICKKDFDMDILE
ncbi:hypothetical protein ACSLMH_04400 [Flavobacterium columnare]|uniref:hypothetical protein n=1 Tax=Flavobacterium columnare TaxID=996 RepID=UPI0040345995